MGTYVAGCNCHSLCPCPVDEKPNSEEGECFGTIVMGIREGDLDGTDLSGTAFALYNHFPDRPSAGNWDIRVVIDEDASEEQANALQRIVGGEEGGAFADLGALIGNATFDRGPVSLSGADAASVEGSEIRFEPFRGPDGTPTTVSSAMFGLAAQFRVGKSTGRYSAFGRDFEATYGESAEMEFASDAAEVRGRF